MTTRYRLRPVVLEFVLLIVLAWSAIPMCAFGEGKSEEKTNRFSDAHFALGTVCTITLYGPRNDDILEDAFRLIDRIEASMSATESTSEVSAVNEAAGVAPVTVSSDTFYVIEQSLGFAEFSDGKFDITVHPLVELWGIGTEFARIPEAAEIDTARALIDSGNIVLDATASSVSLRKPGMSIDLGGIAKGFAADQVREYLVSAGYERGILNFGGNVIAFGEKPGGEPWTIGIQDPYDSRGTPVLNIELSEGAIVTSGVYERYFERDGKLYHHILDPDTGYPVENNVASVTIVAADGITADAFSTIAFATGVTKGIALLESVTSVEGIYVTNQHEIFTTSGLAARISVNNAKYSLKTINY